ncbi:NADPH:quinone reductase/Zn-dependent oxidoreductase [Desulfuromonas soudanensis]|uniref:NADPH:quinone reductase/Zn-dependent oxidoreductase n=1 Tax=Desulfuromonas soudanensis TaxID=1603606 RepID=A0A0M3QF49_9BACT|nr:NADPH:quinone reductase [Desulfuromonas soudanensis]ALC15599.1 NADPH:quinone reductase/Zn-dependent oxidoreductase [Desulfuromonas soudanensis]
MKAIRVHEFGPPEAMLLEEVPPLAPGPGEVVVRLQAVGVNPVDTYIRSGLYAPDLPLPYTPGSDGAGIIEAVGTGVRHRTVGQRVYVARSLSGTYAEAALCKEFHTHPLPEKTSFGQGAAIGVPYGAAFRALFQRAHAVPGETVLVHGASGGVGIAAVQLARAAGLRVIGTAGTAEGEALVAAQGAHHVLNHREKGYLEKLPELTCGAGVDVILEMLANVNLDRDLGVLAKGGRVVVIGSRGRVEIDPRTAMGREAAILGMILFAASDKEQASMHAALAEGMRNGTLQPVVSRELPLAKAAAAHHAVMETSTCGKIVLLP